VHGRAMEKPKDSKEMKDLKRYVEGVGKELGELGAVIATVRTRLDFLGDLYHPVADDDVMLSLRTFQWQNKIQPALQDASERVLAQEEKMEDALRSRRGKFEDELKQATDVVGTFAEKGDPGKVAEYAVELAELRKRLVGLSEEMETINEQEEIMGWNQSSYPQLDKALKDLDPYELLYQTTTESRLVLHKWMHGPIKDLEPDDVDKEVGNMWRNAYKLCKTFATSNAPLRIAEAVKGEVGEFKVQLPLIAVLCNKGLRDRHWDGLNQLVGMNIKPSDRTSLADFVAKKLDGFLDGMREVSDCASKEWSLEKTLDKMLNDWKPVKFETMPYRDTGTFILAGGCIDEIQMMLDDHIVKTQTMLASPFIKPFEERGKDWEKFLLVTQDVIDVWLKVR
jgi:dynein heavy chain, axonemal